MSCGSRLAVHQERISRKEHTMDDEARLERRGSHGLSGWSFILRGSMRTIQSSDKVVIGTEYTDDTSM